jgi:hypothetical protein
VIERATAWRSPLARDCFCPRSVPLLGFGRGSLKKQISARPESARPAPTLYDGISQSAAWVLRIIHLIRGGSPARFPF